MTHTSTIAIDNVFSRLSTSTVQKRDDNIKNNSNSSEQIACLDEDSTGRHYGTFTWPSGACYKGEFCGGRRNGHGVQTWQDNSMYEGEFFQDMRHGYGVHKWNSGQVYEGQFFKDHRHGKGTYSWPDGTKFKGMFYLDRKEGYGTFSFANGDQFEGLYKMDERFGPGVLTYKDHTKGQEIGLWHRERLLKICISANRIFTINDHPEYLYYPDEHKSKLNLVRDYDCEFHKVFVRESSSYTYLSNDFKTSLFAENTALPAGLEFYSSNFEHLPLTHKHKQEFDSSFFGAAFKAANNDSNIELTATNNTPLLMAVEEHVFHHRCFSDAVQFDINSIMAADRTPFPSKVGHLELLSQSLIDMAAAGNEKMVYSILKTGLVDPNVSDKKGNVALIGAAVNCHPNIVNILLDMGANVNQVTDEGLSALTACHIFYYPVDHFKPNVPEDSIKQFENLQAMANKKVGKGKRASLSKTPSRMKAATSLSKGGSAQQLSSHEIHAHDEAEPLPGGACRSDIRILKSRHQMISEAESNKKMSLLDASNFAASNIGDGSSLDISSRKSLSEKPTFESNQNVVHLDISVTDQLIDQTATLLSLNQQFMGHAAARDDELINLGTPSALAVWKAEHSQLYTMIKLLLQRGADPNVGTVPYPALFFAVKAGDVAAVDHLLEKGAGTEYRLSDKLFGLSLLHIAAGIRCPEGVAIVESLLKANADPNVVAADDHVSFEVPKRKKQQSSTALDETGSEKSRHSSAALNNLTPPNQTGANVSEESGRTPLHFACMRDDDYESCREIVRLLLYHGANPDVNWSGQSPLTLAITSGSDLCIDQLLEGGADPSMQLTRGVATALCAACNIKYERRRNIAGRLGLINKLMHFGADILAPVQFGPKKLTGTVVDYAHWMFMSDRRIAHTPYHALVTEEREIYTERRNLLAHVGDLLRQAAVNVEHGRLMKEFKDGSKNQSASSPTKTRRFVYAGTRPELLDQTRSGSALKKPGSGPRRLLLSQGSKAASPIRDTPGVTISRVSFVPPDDVAHSADGIISTSDDDLPRKNLRVNRMDEKKEMKSPLAWKPFFRYCYDCGRSVGVRLTACSRCHEVFFCSRACKLKAWEERHKDECLRIKVRKTSPEPTPSEVAAIFAERSLDETMERARVKTESSIVDLLLGQQLEIAEENVVKQASRSVQGSRQHSRIHTGRVASSRVRGNELSASSRRAPSSKKSIRSEPGIRSKAIGERRRPAKVSKRTRANVGKDLDFGTTGMTLAELGITENYSFE